MAVTLAALAKGDCFERPAVATAAEWVAAYVAAVEDGSIGRYPGLVPPMGVAALAIRALLEEAPLPDGAVHLGQELAFLDPVAIGEALTVSAQVANRTERAGWALLVVETAVFGAGGRPVMSGRSTLTFPAAGTGALPDLPQPLPLAARDDAPVFERRLTQEKIAAYAGASGDHNPLHVDPEFAAGTRFGGTIAHGMLVLSYLSEMMALECGEEWMTAGQMKVRFRGAARPGETVRVFRSPRGSGGRDWDVEARNEREELLVSGQAGLR